MALTDSPDAEALAARLAEIAIMAGAVVMDAFEKRAPARLKADASPVTEADERAEALILAALADWMPSIPVVSEEAVASAGPPSVGADYFLVDPLDGTREFIAGRDEFTVNIALVRDGLPVCGAIFAPALGRLWRAGNRAWETHVQRGELRRNAAWREICARDFRAGGVALVSRSHPDARSAAFLDGIGVSDRQPIGSSLKFGLIASGEADVCPRFGPTMAWDVAAGHAILHAAGGVVLHADGRPMRYDTADFRNQGYIAWGRASPSVSL